MTATTLRLRHACLTSSLFRRSVKLSLDFLTAVAAWALALLLFEKSHAPRLAGFVWGLVALGVALGLQLHRQHYRFVGFRDFLRIVFAGVILLPMSIGLHWFLWKIPIGATAWISAALLTAVVWIGIRVFARIHYEFRPNRHGRGHIRTLIVGAGRAGMLAADEMLRHAELECEIVGFVDDDPSKQGLLLHGIPVLGTQEDLVPLVEDEQISQVVLAIPSASGKEMRHITERTQNLKVDVKTVPGIFTLLGHQTWKPELRPISIEDLLRRAPITLDQEALADAVENQVVLVTGGGGSIGCEIARHICRFHPSRIVLLGRGENSLWDAERSIRSIFPDQPLTLALCDVRHQRRLEEAFQRWHPNVVFHAAAHKHVPFLEAHPEEAVENNIFGTLNVLETSIRHAVPHFVNISTDKAVHPSNVLGVSKRIAEYLVMDAISRIPSSFRYVSVRFGNVLGSRGSVIPIFQEQIRRGGPITVTHPDMTRYFMTIPEAGQLVIQAGLLGMSGKVYVLDMGEPVKIADLAKDMIRLNGLQPDLDIEVSFTGIRPGEKLFEELFYGDTQTFSPVHPKVYEAQVECMASLPIYESMRRMTETLALEAPERIVKLVEIFQKLVPTYTPAVNGVGQWLRASHPAKGGAQ